jgi:dTMP kinase
MDKRGKLIVIDGSDGSGKATQTKLLVERMQTEHKTVETMDFPQYQANQIGKLIGECLAGEHGDFLHSDPYVASVLYGADRFESKQKIETWLESGSNVILDRYTSANQIHQGGKIADDAKRSAFLSWLDKLEYSVFGLPRADLTIYLRMPTELSVGLLKEKRAKDKKQYLADGKVDTVELDVAYLEHAQMAATWLMKENSNERNLWQKIECAPEGVIRERADIHQELWNVVQSVLIK